MPPRIIAITERTWETDRLTRQMILSAPDEAEGVVLDICSNTINSLLIGQVMLVLERCKKRNINVKIVVHDDLTYRSLSIVGVKQLASLELVSK